MSIRRAMSGSRVNRDRRDAAAEKAVEAIESTPPITLESFESPESSTISHAQYDAQLHLMTVWFKTGFKDDRCYVYDVPATVWEGFAAAPSKGQYFARHIRPMLSLIHI